MSIAEQIKCKVHPSEYITNYCAKQNCYLQLCATCICQHTQYHNRINNKPQYQNIKQTYLKTYQNLNKFKQTLNKEKTRIKNLMDGIQKKRKQVKKTFKNAKQEVLTLVERTFSDLEKQFNDQLVRQKQKTGLLNQSRLDQIYSQINKRSLQVYIISQQLSNLRQPSNIKKVNTQLLPAAIQFWNQISQQISTNQLFQPSLSYKSSYLEQVSGSLKRLISISFSYPVSGDFRPTRRNENNKTPIKDTKFINNHPNHMYNHLNRTNQIFTNNPIDVRSPEKLQVQNSRLKNMRNTTKQNFLAGKPGIGLKVFGNTFSN